MTITTAAAQIVETGYTRRTVWRHGLAAAGVAMAAVVARRAGAPRRTFLRTTGALLVLSFVPDLTVGFDAASAATLMSLHAVAAAIVVPTLAARLTSRR